MIRRGVSNMLGARSIGEGLRAEADSQSKDKGRDAANENDGKASRAD
jgi:hypothetical protein